MPACSALNCKYRHVNVKTTGRTVHAFPFSRPEILEKWVSNMKREEDWYPSKRSILCSDHFEPDCFDRTKRIVRLKPDAVPTKFNFPPHLTKKCKKRKYPSECCLDAELDLLESNAAIDEDHMYNKSQQNLQDKLEHEMEQSTLYRKMLKIKQQRIRRLVKRVRTMNGLVDNLRQNQLVDENAAHLLKSFMVAH